MSRNRLTLKKENHFSITEEKLIEWFKAEGFRSVNFKNGKFELLAYWLGYPIYHKLRENMGYTTFIKQAFGGSLLVFETKLTDTEFDCQCYAPIMLFGYKRIELSFQKKALWITKYRKEGYHILKQFEKFIFSKPKP